MRTFETKIKNNIQNNLHHPPKKTINLFNVEKSAVSLFSASYNFFISFYFYTYIAFSCSFLVTYDFFNIVNYLLVNYLDLDKLFLLSEIYIDNLFILSLSVKCPSSLRFS